MGLSQMRFVLTEIVDYDLAVDASMKGSAQQCSALSVRLV
jgi:hypothetical protein